MAGNRRYILGIDIGGTKILAALFDRKFRILGEKKAKTEANRGEKFFLATIKQAVEDLLEDEKISKKNLRTIGVGCPGMIKCPEGCVKLSPNLAFLTNYPLGERIKKMFKLPVFVENDVNAGLYGEYRLGAAKGFSHVLGIFPGTGVGGAMILDGRLYRGATGAAGEIGHTFLSLPSFLSSVGGVETLETLIGRLRIASEAGFLITKQKAKRLFQEVGYDIRKIKSKAIVRAIKSGDLALRDLIEDKAQILGFAMAGAVNLLNPELVVLGGGLIEALGKWILPVARETMKKYALPPVVKSVRVVRARLKDHSVVIGAAQLAEDYLCGRREGEN
jgi:glucokinase